METMLRLQCDNLLGGRIERETPTGLVTIATVARETDGLVVHVIDGQEGPGLGISRAFRRGTVTTCSAT